MFNQKTIKNAISFEGVGLHSGSLAKLTIKPSPPNTGIIFKRVDLRYNNKIFPNFDNVTNTELNTTISNSYGRKVSTIEHLMGALYGLGIDNALIEIDNEEIPILDGSAKIFVEKISNVGLQVSDQAIKIIKINRKVEFFDKNRFISIEPSKFSLNINFELKFQNKLIGTQKNNYNIFEDNLSDVYNSRTFCLFEDIEKIKKLGLAKGGSLDNAIVVKDDKILNESGLRNKKEFVNHKILDCMGDLFTAGYKIIGNLNCSQGGHFMTNALLRKLFQSNENYTLMEIKEKNLPHNFLQKNILKSIA